MSRAMMPRDAVVDAVAYLTPPLIFAAACRRAIFATRRRCRHDAADCALRLIRHLRLPRRC